MLTTNRVELLEPALAARPGRVDLAVELPLPGLEERRRLLDVYTRDLDVAVDDWTPVAARCNATAASFIRELVRTAALTALLDDGGALEERHFTAALDELLESGPLK